MEDLVYYRNTFDTYRNTDLPKNSITIDMKNCDFPSWGQSCSMIIVFRRGFWFVGDPLDMIG